MKLYRIALSSSLRRCCAALLIGLLVSCAPAASSPPPTPAAAVPAARVPALSHVFVIILENKEYSGVLGSPLAPYLNLLAQQYGLATNYYAVAHPSLPNYLALTAGNTFGITGDCLDCWVGQPNLVDQLETAGRSWKAYMEDMPTPCYAGDAAPLYRQKHNPFIYYNDVRNDPARCQKIVPFTQFGRDLQAGALPNFVWITPNMRNDAHDGSLVDSDAWLRTWVPQIVASPAWRDGGALFITFDEGKKDGSSPGGQVVTLVISPLGRSSYQSGVAYTHYSLLRTIEDGLGLPPLGAAASATPMGDFFDVGEAVAR